MSFLLACLLLALVAVPIGLIAGIVGLCSAADDVAKLIAVTGRAVGSFGIRRATTILQLARDTASFTGVRATWTARSRRSPRFGKSIARRMSLFALLLPREYRERVWVPLQDEIVEDHILAMREHRGRAARMWIKIATVFKCAVAGVQCTVAAYWKLVVPFIGGRFF